jgi:hypothetical protein
VAGIGDPRQCAEVAVIDFILDPGIEFDGPIERTGIARHEHRYALAQIVYDIATPNDQDSSVAQGT